VTAGRRLGLALLPLPIRASRRFVRSVSLFCESPRRFNVLVLDASVFAHTPGDRLLSEATLDLSGTVRLMILYRTPKAELQSSK
jgi:hypothetical protein